MNGNRIIIKIHSETGGIVKVNAGVAYPWNVPVPGPQGEPGEDGIDGEKGEKGEKGDTGNDAVWTELTKAQYLAIPVKDPNKLYVIIG